MANDDASSDGPDPDDLAASRGGAGEETTHDSWDDAAAERVMSAVPPLYHSEYREGPFVQCDLCEGDLTRLGCRHVVFKHYLSRSDGHRETIFETAVCMSCVQSRMPQPSEESVRKLIAFRLERRQAASIRFGWIAPPSLDDLAATPVCELCGCTATTCRTFSVRAEVTIGSDRKARLDERRGDLLAPPCPSMLCDGCHAATVEVLSAKTREDFGGFYEQNYPQPSLELDDAPLPVLV